MITQIKSSIKSGLGFGLTSGVITTLGLIVGLYSGTDSKIAVIGGIFTIAVADAFSDALGIHVSQESQNQYTIKQIWIATLTTFLTKILFALTFLIPIILIQFPLSIFISVVWGLSILSIFSYVIAKQAHENPSKVIAEHLVIGLVVILITHLLGDWIAARFS